MLLLNIALLALSALPTSLAKHHSHSSASTFTTMTSASNATVTSMTTAGIPGGSHCPTVTKTVQKTEGVCDEIKCLPVGPLPTWTSTFVVGCGCPAATPTTTLSLCDTGCQESTTWLYKTAGGC